MSKMYYSRKTPDVLPVGRVLAEELKVLTALCTGGYGSYGKPGDFCLTDSMGRQQIVDRFTFYANYEPDDSPPAAPRAAVWEEPVSSPPPIDVPVAACWTWHENGDPSDVRSQIGIARLHAVNSDGQFHYSGQHWQALDPDGSWLLAGLPKAWTGVPAQLLEGQATLPGDAE